MLRVEIFDKDIGRDDFLCDNTIPLDSVFKQFSTNQWYPLFKKGKEKGQINL